MRKTIHVGGTINHKVSRDHHDETINSFHRPLYEDPKDFFSASLKLRASSQGYSQSLGKSNPFQTVTKASDQLYSTAVDFHREHSRGHYEK